MNFNKKRRIFHFAVDMLALILVSASFQLLLERDQSITFWLVWLIGTLTGLYLIGRYNSQEKNIFPSIIKIGIGSLPILLISYPLLAGLDTFRTMLLLGLYLVIILLLSVISFTKIHLNLFQKKNQEEILFILKSNLVDGGRYREFKNKLHEEGYRVTEYIMRGNDTIKLPKVSKWHFVVYDQPVAKDNSFASLLLEEKIKGKKVIDFIKFYSQFTGRVPLDLIDESYLLNSGNSFFEKKILNRFIRIIDLFISSILIPLFLIPALIIGLFVRLESKGSVIFYQERVGKNLKPFTLYKFRSMRVDAEKNGPQWATTNDTRATKVGSILRKTHLDELPQILNVFLGDMTLVGPRPIRLHFTQELTQKIPFYHLRNFIKPGLTGWTQINAPRGANIQEEKIKLEMDLYYLLNASLMLNLYILLGTGKHMISPSSNSHSNSKPDLQVN